MSDKLCFVIGPMRDMARLKRLADEIIAPLVKDQGYRVETPDQPDIGNIMDQVIAMLDRADLVIADLTGNNPNVFYELGIRQCIGRAYITVKEETGDPAQDKTPFDLAAYRYTAIRFDQVQAAQATLRPVIAKVQADLEKGERVHNPVTDFYGAPLPEVSPAAGLALGYYRNFVLPTAQKLQDATRYIKIDGQAIEASLRKGAKLEIVIPQTLDQAWHDYIGDFLVEKNLLKRAVIQLKPPEPRDLTLYAFPDMTDGCRLVDIPTTMNVMKESIRQRLGQGEPNTESLEWKSLERQEINRFRSALLRKISDEDRYKTVVKTKVIVSTWGFPSPD